MQRLIHFLDTGREIFPPTASLLPGKPKLQLWNGSVGAPRLVGGNR
jgi:hypothetical protein